MEHDLEAILLAGGNDADLEQVILHNIIGDEVEVEANIITFNLENMTPEDVKLNFRFERPDIYRLARALRIPETVQTTTRNRVTGVTGLRILLRRLAYPGRLKDIQLLFNMSPQSLSQVIKHMVSFISDNHGHLLDNLETHQWLNLERMELYAEAVRNKGGAVPNCWGFIDGTARPICRPSVNQEDYYSGHKRQHYIKYQSVLCPDGIIVSLKGGYIRRRHDAGIFRESNLYEELRQKAVFPNNRKFVLFGDQAYPISDLLLCPYPTRQEALPIHQQELVEWGFQKVISQFAFLDLKKNQKLLLQDVENMYRTAVIFTNCHITLYGSQSSHFFNVLPPTLENYVGN